MGECNNWGGITLLPITITVFSKIIHTRLAAALDEHIRQEQAGFRPGRSCSEHILPLRQILELAINVIPLCMPTSLIWNPLRFPVEDLEHYGILSKLVNVIKMIYNDCKSQVIYNAVLTDTFRVTTGVKQGCILSPFLFILGIDWITTQVTSNRRRGITWTLTSILEDLDYTDHIGLLSPRYQDIQAKTNTLATTARTSSLEISTKKTRHLRINSRSREVIMLNGETIEDVEHFTYLGSKVSISGDGEEEILARISKAS